MNRPKVPQIFKPEHAEKILEYFVERGLFGQTQEKTRVFKGNLITIENAQQIFESWLESQKVVYMCQGESSYWSEAKYYKDTHTAYLVCETELKRECEKHEPNQTEFIDTVSCKHCHKKLVADWRVVE